MSCMSRYFDEVCEDAVDDVVKIYPDMDNVAARESLFLCIGDWIMRYGKLTGKVFAVPTWLVMRARVFTDRPGEFDDWAYEV